MKKFFIAILICIAILSVVGLYFVKYYALAEYEYEPVRVEIPAGSTESEVKSHIEGALGNSFGSKVSLLWSLQGGNAPLAHGSYLVKPGDHALRVARAIAKGRQTPVRFTFNNVRLMGELAARVGAEMECDSAAFMAAVDSVLAGDFKREEYPAAFLPDTYEFYWSASPETIVNSFVRYRNKFWNDEHLEKAAKLGLTPAQVHTLASIVEEETNKADERPKVARLYLNRLDAGMRLQADPTVKFASKNFALKRLSGNLLKIDSPYNTYEHEGLPPGPIRIAEKATIDAVLNCPKHNYLYMCAKSDFSGYHDFAENYSQHRINAARYHRALNERGIK